MILLRVSGGNWPYETSATALCVRCYIQQDFLKDKKMSTSASYLRRAILFTQIKKGGKHMTTLQELFKELDNWEQHSPKSWAGSMGRTAKINDIKRQIKEAITIKDIRKYILNKED